MVKESLSWVTIPEHVTVTTDFDSTFPKVMADAEQIGRSFANIISNAVQSMRGGGELRISTGVEGSYARVAFKDTGCGIPRVNLGKIFEPLFTTKPKGVGLGLAITRRLIEQNSGTIEVKSQVDKGTVFIVRLVFLKSSGVVTPEGQVGE